LAHKGIAGKIPHGERIGVDSDPVVRGPWGPRLFRSYSRLRPTGMPTDD
jgi:hypothetical protein